MVRAFSYLILLLLTPVLAHPQDLRWVALQEIHLSAWAKACEAKRYDCSVLPFPTIGYGVLLGVFGSFAPGSRILIVHVNLMYHPASILVLVHEMIHYIQEAEGAMTFRDPNFKPHCQREEESFELTYSVNERYQITSEAHYAPRWEDIKHRYLHCNLGEFVR